MKNSHRRGMVAFPTSAMPSLSLTRRAFCATAAAFATQPALPQTAAHLPPPTSRPDVAAHDRTRILAAADRALAEQPAPLTGMVAPKSPGTPHDFFSEADSFFPDPAAPAKPYKEQPGTLNAAAFTAHRDALFTLGRGIAALAAAFHITHDEKYAAHANFHLRAWFVDPATRMTPALTYGSMIPNNPKPRPEGLLEAVPLAEIAQALPFLPPTDDTPAIKSWLTAYLTWLTENRLAGLARDSKDHHGTSWLFQAAAIARLTGNEAALADLRHRFKTVTLRAEIVADGTFPHELTTPFPYRLSLFNLDMLAAACDLLSTRFESLWQFELQDGPGLHVSIARHFPYIERRGAWPYRADLTHFADLPLRRDSLLLAARAYNRPEYAALWASLPPDSPIPEIARTLPLSQPLLWTARPPLPAHPTP